MNNEEKAFINGCSAKRVTTKFGDIIKLSGKTDEFIESLKKYTNKGGWFNFDIKTSKSGDKMYVENNDFQPVANEGGTPSGSSKAVRVPASTYVDDLPF